MKRCLSSESVDPNNPWVTDAWELRFDSGRERYLAQHWQTLDPNLPWFHGNDPAYWHRLGATWTHYLGGEPWGDYGVTVDPNDPNHTAAVSEQTRYFTGLGVQGQDDLDPNNPARRYYHGDMIGSTMTTSDGDGNITMPLVWYTAFGERVWKDGAMWSHFDEPLPEGYPRYAYGGAYGYESGPWGQDTSEVPSPGPLVLYGANRDLPPIQLLHVGERWYQPGTGRFVQRDPIGIEGGFNCYAYCGAVPTGRVDPEGESLVWVVAWVLRAAATVVTWFVGKPQAQQTAWNFCARMAWRLSTLGKGYRQPPIERGTGNPIVWVDPRKW
jgi:RHS repeat-associated protein